MKTDARVRYTRMRIREAFLRCLREKPVNKITVTELCELAEINRATFYTHYRDPFDLLERLEEEGLEHIRAMLAAKERAGDPLLPSLLHGIREQRDDMGLLGSANGDPRFMERISALFYEQYEPRVAAQLPRLGDAAQREAYRFLVGGCSSLIADWIAGGMVEEPEAVAGRIGRISTAVVAAFADLGAGA